MRSVTPGLMGAGIGMAGNVVLAIFKIVTSTVAHFHFTTNQSEAESGFLTCGATRNKRSFGWEKALSGCLAPR